MTVERYNAREAEARWQKVWDEQGIFATRNDDPRPKFPYPSARIHMGQVRNYTVDYVVARFKRDRPTPAMLAEFTPSVYCAACHV
jgi:leucyl-tRNA synthetase